jgi:hypothetical protein
LKLKGNGFSLLIYRCFDEPVLLASLNNIQVTQQMIKEFLNLKQYSRLESLLSEIQTGEISTNILNGKFPLKGWTSIVPHAYSSQQTYRTLYAERQDLASQIQELELKLDHMKQQFSQLDSVMNQTDYASVALCQKLGEFAECETGLVQEFQQKIASPNWNIEDMSMDDLNMALQIREVVCVPLLIERGYSVTGVLYSLDFHVLEDQFPSLGLEEKLDLLYGNEMIKSNCFDPKVHEENCGVCSNTDVLELLREFNLADDLCRKLPLANLKSKHLLVIPPKQLCSGVDPKLVPEIIACLGQIKKAHLSCLSV